MSVKREKNPFEEGKYRNVISGKVSGYECLHNGGRLHDGGYLYSILIDDGLPLLTRRRVFINFPQNHDPHKYYKAVVEFVVKETEEEDDKERILNGVEVTILEPNKEEHEKLPY